MRKVFFLIADEASEQHGSFHTVTRGKQKLNPSGQALEAGNAKFNAVQK